MSASVWGVVIATFVACVVEMVEATTIVMAMGFTRGWRSTLAGAFAAVGALAVVTAIAGYAITTWLPQSALQLVIGTLLLVFGLQWLRKAILRSAGRKAMHDEDAIYRKEVAASNALSAASGGVDTFAFIVSFKGVFLEGMEVVFIVLTFGVNAHNIMAASAAAAAAAVVVLIIAIVLRRPLSMINENLLKYGVSLLLTSFGTYWAVEGLGLFRRSHESLGWPGHDLSILVLFLVWLGLSRLFIVALHGPAPSDAALGVTDLSEGSR